MSPDPVGLTYRGITVTSNPLLILPRGQSSGSKALGQFLPTAANFVGIAIHLVNLVHFGIEKYRASRDIARCASRLFPPRRVGIRFSPFLPYRCALVSLPDAFRAWP